jgi:hypothetical protein
MDEPLNGWIAKVGLDKGTAETVRAFLDENAGKLPQWIASNETAKNLASNIPGAGSLFGGGDKDA